MMNEMVRSLTIALVSLCLTACSTMPETKIYSLSFPDERGVPITRSGASLAIVVESPRYLAQPYIAHRSSPYQLEISKYSKWDAAPVDILKEILRDSISSLAVFKKVQVSNVIQSESYLLIINLKRFERYYDGSGWFGELVFDAAFTGPDEKELFHRTIQEKINLEDRTYVALAKGLSTALAKATEEIKTAMVEALSKPVP